MYFDLIQLLSLSYEQFIVAMFVNRFSYIILTIKVVYLDYLISKM